MVHQKHEYVLPPKNGVHWTKNIQFEKKYPKINKNVIFPLMTTFHNFHLKIVDLIK